MSKFDFTGEKICRTLIIGGSRSGKTNALLDLINHQSDTDKIYMFAKDPYKKHRFLIKEQESIALKHLIDLKAFT